MDTLRTSLKSPEKGSVFTAQWVLKGSPRLVVKGSSMAQVEHIDNPKGYGDGQDPREVDPGLRPVFLVTGLSLSEPLTVSRCYSPYW